MDNFKILIADDDDNIRELILNLLSPFGYTLFTAKDGKETLTLTENERPDLLICDIDMPFLSGYEVCKKIKENKDLSFIYVVIVTGSSITPDAISLGFDYGADDYLCKPFHNKEFLGRIKSAIRIKKLHDDVLKLSITDELTGIYNRRFFDQFSANELYRAERYKRPVSCFMIDIDFFKKINDTYGHEAGDVVLKNTSEILKKHLRRSDSTTLCRYGGEEFVVLLPETDSKGALICAENLRKQIENNKIIYDSKEIAITVSIGIASLFENPVSVSSELIRYADIALYKSKEAGRNCIKHISG